GSCAAAAVPSLRRVDRIRADDRGDRTAGHAGRVADGYLPSDSRMTDPSTPLGAGPSTTPGADPVRRPTFQHRLEYLTVMTARACVRRLPMGVVLAAGTVL